MSRLTDYRNSRPPSRPDSANLVDLHVYIVPPDIWRDRFNNLLNQAVSETISIGIIRVSPDLKLTDIRDELPRQLEDLVPGDFIFLRSVGRSLTRLKPKQEFQLKAKHFLPPVAYAPELYLLEATADIRASLTSDGSSRSQSYNRLAGEDSQRGFHSYRDGPGGPGGPGGPYDDRYTQTRRPQPYSHNKGQGQNDPHSSPNTNHTNEDSGFAGLSPDERERDNYLEDYERRKRELQQRLDREKAKQNQLNRHNEELARLAELDEAERLAEEKRREEEYERRRFDSEEQRKQEEEEERRRAEDRRREEARRKDERQREDEERRREEEQRREDQRLENENEREKRRKDDEERWRQEDEERERLRNLDADQRKKEDELRAKRRKDEEEAKRKREEERKGRGNATNRRKGGDEDDNKRNQGKGRNSEDEKRRRADDDKKKNGRRGQGDDKSGRNRSRFGENDDRLTNGNDTDHSRWDDEDGDSRRYRDKENDDNDSRRYRDNDNDHDGRRRSGSADDDDFPSPPSLEMKSPQAVRDTDSAYARRRDEKERLLAELDEARDQRKSAEQDREELVKRAKQLQHKTTNRRNNARDVWKKRYFEEKKRTAPLEDSTNRLRHELEVLHRKLMTTLEGPKDGKPVKYVDGKPSPKNNYIIQCTRLQHEIEDLRRRSENAKMKLTAEMKLRNQADAELRALRAELTQKKINLTLSRNRQLVALSPGAEMMDGREEITAQN